jgi:hypothetical protein
MHELTGKPATVGTWTGEEIKKGKIPGGAYIWGSNGEFLSRVKLLEMTSSIVSFRSEVQDGPGENDGLETKVYGEKRLPKGDQGSGCLTFGRREAGQDVMR